MRVISGFLKGRKIDGMNIHGTRPTMDRVKESVFASIQGKIDNSVCLDLFAGSGSLGIEAISNGARKVYFVDNNIECIKIINKNIFDFGIERKCALVIDDYNNALKEAEDYIDEHSNEFESDDKETSQEKIDHYKINAMKEVTDKVSYTINFSLIKDNKKWVLEKINDSDLEKIHGLYED